MKQLEWTQTVYVGNRKIAQVKRVNIIGERRSDRLFTPKLEYKTLRYEFVEPGIWQKIN